MPHIDHVRTMDLQKMFPRQFQQHFFERQTDHFAFQAIAGGVMDEAIMILHSNVGNVRQRDDSFVVALSQFQATDWKAFRSVAGGPPREVLCSGMTIRESARC